MQPPAFDVNALAREAHWVRRLARSLVADPHLAEDVAQEAFRLALERRPQAHLPMRAWLGAVARRVARNFARSDARRVAREAAAAQPEAQPGADELVLRVFGMRALGEAVLALEEPYRTAILLRHLEDLPPKRIAERLGVPVATVNSRLSRGLEKLRERLERSRRGSEPWLGALLAWKRPAGIVGGVAMSTGTKVAVAGACVLTALGFLFLRGFGSAGPNGADAESKAELSLSAEADVPPAEPADFGGSRSALDAPGAAQDSVSAVSQVSDDELRGIVVTEAGMPIAGAHVGIILEPFRQVLFMDADNREPVRLSEAWTTDTGEFRFDLEPGRGYDLEAKAEGFATAFQVSHYPGEFVRIVLPRAAAIRGVVTAAETNTPIAGAWIMANGKVLGTPGIRAPQTVTDASGRYAFEGLLPGAYELSVEHSQYPRQGAALALHAGEDSRWDVALIAGDSLRGFVRDTRTGDPIAGARISRSWTMNNAAESALDGAFTIGWPPADRPPEIHVVAPGYARTGVPGPSRSDQPFVLLMSAGCTVRGRLVGPEGEAIAGAFVVLNAAGGEPSLVDRVDGVSTQSDLDGRFEVSDVRVDIHHTLVACARGYAVLAVDLPNGSEGDGVVDLGRLQFEAAGTISGCLVEPDGSPLAGLFIVLDGDTAGRDEFNPGEFLPGGSPFRRILAPTDERGRFWFSDLPAGSYYLSGGAKGFARRADLEMEIASGEQLTDLVLTLDLGLSISGVVVTESGEVMPRIAVSVCVHGQFWNRLAYTIVDEEGRFALRGLEPGRYDLRVQPGFSSAARDRGLVGGAPQEVDAGDENVRLVLRESSPITGRVLGIDGKPIEGCLVQVEPEWSQVVTDSDGRFSIAVAVGTSGNITAFTLGEGRNVPASTDESGSSRIVASAKASGVLAGTKDIVLRLEKQ